MKHFYILILSIGWIMVLGCNDQGEDSASEIKSLSNGECNSITQKIFPDRRLNVSGPEREYLAEIIRVLPKDRSVLGIRRYFVRS
ncbi:MAG: hypothetical protein ACOH5I_20945 [Oligoflexus sp.]